MATNVLALARPVEPKWALVETREGLAVEKFDRKVHISVHGFSYAGVTLFCDPKEVEHLRDQIIN
jgi:hypothetical protein